MPAVSAGVRLLSDTSIGFQPPADRRTIGTGTQHPITDAGTTTSGGSWVNGESGLNMMIRARSLGRVRSRVAAMIAPLEQPMAIGALVKRSGSWRPR
jgi:hypothetical protein